MIGLISSQALSVMMARFYYIIIRFWYLSLMCKSKGGPRRCLQRNKRFSWSDSSFISTLCLHNCTRCLELSFLYNAISTAIANRNCLGQFHKIPWNQTTNVHRGSSLITLVISWRWHNITWRWRHRNHANTITRLSVIQAKQAAKNEVYAFSIKYGYSDILLKNT